MLVFLNSSFKTLEDFSKLAHLLIEQVTAEILKARAKKMDILLTDNYR